MWSTLPMSMFLVSMLLEAVPLPHWSPCLPGLCFFPPASGNQTASKSIVSFDPFLYFNNSYQFLEICMSFSAQDKPDQAEDLLYRVLPTPGHCLIKPLALRLVRSNS